jgi:hypothetical protein
VCDLLTTYPTLAISSHRYEDLVRNPAASTRRICDELLRIIWEPKMGQPYDSSATESFQVSHLCRTESLMFWYTSYDIAQVTLMFMC